MRVSSLSPSAHRRALQRKLAGLRGKLAVVEREIAEAQSSGHPLEEPGLFGQENPGLRALQDRKRKLELVSEQLEGELRRIS